MAGKLKIALTGDGPASPARPQLFTAAELALFDALGEVAGSRWWHGMNALDADGWTCMRSGLQLAPAPGNIVPTFVPAAEVPATNGAPDNVPFGQGAGFDPAGMLISPDGTDVIDLASDFSILFLAAHGTAATSGLWGIVGSAGRAVLARLRSGSLAQLDQYDAANPPVATQRFSVTVSNGWHRLEYAYKASTGVLQLNVDGVVVATSTALAAAQTTKRLSLWGGFDLTANPAISFQGRGVKIAHCVHMPGVYLPDNESLRAKWRAMIASRAPSIPA